VQVDRTEAQGAVQAPAIAAGGVDQRLWRDTW